MKNFQKELDKELTFMSYAPSVFISVKDKLRVKNVLIMGQGSSRK